VSKKPKRKKTELGRALAKVRIDFDQTGADMAKKLGVSASQMFNIEVGLAQVGYEFIGKIKEIYSIDLTEIMRRGGFMSKITLDLDELSQADKDTVLEIWTRRLVGDPLRPVETAVLEKTSVTVSEEKSSTASSSADTSDARKRRGRPKTIRAGDDIGFLEEEGVDDLDGLEEADVL